MKRSLSRKSIVLGMSGMLTAGLFATAYGATAANAATVAAQAHGPSWHTILSLPDGKTPSNTVETVIATGRTTGWAFLSSSPVAYERTGNTSWRTVALPERGGAVSVAGASSSGNVWAAYRTASGGTHLDHWNGRRWTTVKSFPGQVTGISVLGPNDVWVFGGQTNKATKAPQGVFHFNGRGWTQVSSAWQGGYALSDGNVWTYSGTTTGHFNGRKWTETNVAKLFPARTVAETTNPMVTGIIALSPDNVYASGEGPIGAHIANGVILHFNGRTWSKAAGGGFLSSDGQPMASDGHGGLYLPAGNVEGPSLLFHYSAGQVTRVKLPGGGTLPTSSESVSQVPGTAEVLSGGSIYHATNAALNRSVVFQLS